jgi:biotin carboxyl carrier protein
MAEVKVPSEISGSVWKILVKAGDKVEEEQPIAILESMKMEIPVLAPEAGTILEIKVSEGDAIAEGDPVAIVST